MELIRQVEINIDYILMLVAQYHQSNCEDKEVLGAIDRAIDSSIQLRSKKELIHEFYQHHQRGNCGGAGLAELCPRAEGKGPG